MHTPEQLSAMTDRQIDALAVEVICDWKNVHYLPGGNVPFGEPDDDFNRDVAENVKELAAGNMEYKGEPVRPHELEVWNFCEDPRACHHWLVQSLYLKGFGYSLKTNQQREAVAVVGGHEVSNLNRKKISAERCVTEAAILAVEEKAHIEKKGCNTCQSQQ